MATIAPASLWNSITSVASYLPSPPVNFASKIAEWCQFIGDHMDFTRQGIGVTRIVVDIEYVLKGKFLHEKTPFGVIGNLLLCISDFGSILPFLHYWKVIDLGKIAGVVGQVRFLAPLMTVPISTLLSVVTSVGYLYFGIDAVYRLFQPETKGPFRRQAWFDVANTVVQLTLSGLLIAGMQKLPVLIPMGAFCLIVGSACFLHRCTLPPEMGTDKKNIKKLPKKPPSAPLRNLKITRLGRIKPFRIDTRTAVEVMT